MEVRIDKCEYCGGPIERAATGRRRRFCDGTCRVAAHRRRHAPELESVQMPVDDLPIPSEPVGAALAGVMVPTDEQVVAALVECSAVEIALGRLGREARPEFAWRCERLSDEIASARRRYFEGVLP